MSDRSFDSYLRAQREYDHQTPDDAEERQARRDRRRQYEEDHADELNDQERDRKLEQGNPE